MNNCFKRIFVNNDLTTANHVVESIERLELIYGRIPQRNIFSIGYGAQIIYNNLMHRHSESNTRSKPGDIDCLILIDRKVDLVTTLITQLTYEGVMDETYGIDNSTSPLLTPSDDQSERRYRGKA